MSRRDDDMVDIPSLVPERDEVVSRGPARRGSSSSRTSGGKSVNVRAGTSGSVRFLLTILTLGMLATGAGAWVFYTQGQVALAELEDANGRLLTLENRLSAVGENTEETTLNLIERIDFNFSEIDKLWAARNQNRQNITENKTALDEQAEVISSMEGALSSQANMLTANAAELSNMKTRVDTITANVASMENIDRELQALSENLAQLSARMEILQPISSRVQTAEQDIESINVYRLQMNQTISTMQDQIRDLQQRLAQ